MLVETDTVHVLATDVNISKLPLEVHTILRQSVPLLVVHTLYVLVEFTDVVRENVTVAKDVLPTLMVIT